jgi:alpha-mannosidase
VGGRLDVTDRLVHMVGNAHIDPVWLWQWPEGYQEVRSTFSSALDRMDEYAEFVFTSNSVLFFAWIEEHDPELFERIRARIAEGRWQVVGGWWLEPDCNIPSGESFVRHALYGQRYLHEKFGITATTGANFDSFGHNATIPQLLRMSGMDSYVFLRPGPTERSLPGQLFRWEAPDGSQVLAYRIPNEYGTPDGDLESQVDKSLAQVPADEPELMIFFGVGNHGGGPTRANLDSIDRLNGLGTLPRLHCSSPREFFDRTNGRELPVVEGELLHHSPGCYSAHSGIKRWNRRCENLLQRAEKWCAVAEAVAGQQYPDEQLQEAWKLLLFNQFHDTLAGTAIKPAYEDARDQLGFSASVAELTSNRAVQAIARQVDIPFEDSAQPVLVFNPHPWPVVADVEVELAGFRGDEPRLTDEEGDELPVQRTRTYATVSSARGRFVFRAELPPLGYRTYRLHPGGRAGGTFEGPVELEIDPATGRLARLALDGVNVIADGPHAVVVRDLSDTWGHQVHAYDDELGEFECRSVRIVEDGPVRRLIRVESAHGSSTLVEEYVLSAGAGHLDVRVTVDWRDQLKLLKLRYPTRGGEATFEIPYGHVVRPADGAENPAQNWVDCGGLSVANDAKYGHDVRGGSIGVTALRSPVYAWHDPRELDPDGIYDYQDQGRQDFHLRLVPHGGDWREAHVVRRAAELNQPPFALLESSHPGTLPRTASFAAGDGGSVVVTVLKRAEDGDALILRAYESAGRAGAATITVLDRAFDANFGASEIKTWRVPRNPEEPIAETDLLEW